MSKNKTLFLFTIIILFSSSAYLLMSRLTINTVGDWEALNLLENKLDNHARYYGINPALNLLSNLTTLNEDSAFTLRIRESLISWLSVQGFTHSQRAKMIHLTKASFAMALTDESRDEHKQVLSKLERVD